MNERLWPETPEVQQRKEQATHIFNQVCGSGIDLGDFQIKGLNVKAIAEYSHRGHTLRHGVLMTISFYSQVNDG